MVKYTDINKVISTKQYFVFKKAALTQSSIILISSSLSISKAAYKKSISIFCNTKSLVIFLSSVKIENWNESQYYML